METEPTLSFWQKNKLVLKSFFIAFLILALLIPTFLIMSLVTDRKDRKQEVTKEISNKWSAAQTITGPFLIIPYTENDISNGNAVTVKKNLFLMPEQLNISGTIEPEIRYRSIYKVPVFTAKPLLLNGKFAKHSFTAVGVNPTAIKWSEAKLCIGISDLKGIKQQSIKWNGQLLNMEAGVPDNSVVSQSISVPMPLDTSFIDSENNFSIQLTLQGSEKIYCTPLGSNTTVHFSSSWSNPAFDGKYLPDTERITQKGFEADWSISQFNRDFPKIFNGAGTAAQSVKESAFGVILLSPFDAYAQTMRSVKYAILIIALTFFALFFTEIFQRKPVHPLQYILIGMALVIFYILLLSVSEYIQFPYAYLLASAATVLLLSWYTKSIFKKWNVVLVFAALLSALYLFIYVLIQMQDNALLFGSVGLFVLLAAAMYLSRKIDWFGFDKKAAIVQQQL
ncbi:cell envelope integrity protein CreD [Ferruginibacter sp. SUN106]|uniref:cell envelope integrity protein CreD n=1 Tax=Ferruginibacter sp. SUN106 TaxID=2978348 RepID=UPI003D36EC93